MGNFLVLDKVSYIGKVVYIYRFYDMRVMSLVLMLYMIRLQVRLWVIY
jgi:hypothetical protein